MLGIIILRVLFYLVCFASLHRKLTNSRRAICFALIPPFLLDSVVAIGVQAPLVLPDGKIKQEIVSSASGFLYGQFIERIDEKQSRFIVYLVTNRHVLDDVIANSNTTKDTIYLRFNPEAAEPARELELNLRDGKGTPRWFTHPCSDVDAAIMPINTDFLKETGLSFPFFKTTIMSRIGQKPPNSG